MVVSQFTLHASLKKGNKPDFHQSASGGKAKSLYDLFYKRVGELYEVDKIKNGIFAAMMDVALVNDGPVVTSMEPKFPTLIHKLGHYSDRYQSAKD